MLRQPGLFWTVAERLVVSGAVLLGACSSQHEPVPSEAVVEPEVARNDTGQAAQDPENAAGQPLQFREIAQSRGLDFHHYSPLTKQRHVHLVMGSGIGWFDFDSDGRPDLFCCQGAAFSTAQSGQEDGDGQRPSDHLYRNTAEGMFEKVSVEARIASHKYSMGIAAADYDNDGFVDVFVSGYEENRLWHNQGDGTFELVRLPKQHQAGRLSASCTWADVDLDGNLDLFVTNYAQLDRYAYPTCTHSYHGRTIEITCHPNQLTALPDLIYRNLGNGEFREVSSKTGIHAAPRHGLGVVAADFDRDGDIDFYVANDTTPNQLWENLGGWQFRDRGVESGTATNRHGAREAGMGIAAGDLDGDGLPDLLVTNYFHETNTFYRNEGNLAFADVTDEMGLGGPSRLRLGFGVSLADFNNDSWPDIMIANGHVHDRLQEIRRDEPFAQKPLLFINRHGHGFRDVSAEVAGYFAEDHVGRGTAVADFDADGDPDIAINGLNEPVKLLENVTDDGHGWISLDLIGTASNRRGFGAVIEISADERKIVREHLAGSSYLSCDSATVLVGIGQARTVDELTVQWPSGRRERWGPLEANQRLSLVEGTGNELSPSRLLP